MRYSGKISIQQVMEAQPAEYDQYGKIKKGATQRTVVGVIEVNVTGATEVSVTQALIKHLETSLATNV